MSLLFNLVKNLMRAVCKIFILIKAKLISICFYFFKYILIFCYPYYGFNDLEKYRILNKKKPSLLISSQKSIKYMYYNLQGMISIVMYYA